MESPSAAAGDTLRTASTATSPPRAIRIGTLRSPLISVRWAAATASSAVRLKDWLATTEFTALFTSGLTATKLGEWRLNRPSTICRLAATRTDL